MQGQLPLNALRAFTVAAQHLSFTKAAEELHVTPAAISQQVKTLEEYLGTPLFHRLTRGLALTKAAQSALPALQEGFAGVAAGMHQLRADSGRNILDVWVAPSFASKWLLPRLNAFTSKHPDIDLRITASGDLVDNDASGTPDQAKHFRRQGMDVAIRFGNGNYPGCHVHKLMPASVAPMCSPDLMRDPQKPLANPQDLRLHTLLHDNTQYQGRPEWSDWFHLAGVDPVSDNHGLHFNHVSLALEAACDRQGVVLSIEQLGQVDIERGRLCLPFDQRIMLDCAYYVINLEESAENPAIVAFREWILSECKPLREDEHLPTISDSIPEPATVQKAG